MQYLMDCGNIMYFLCDIYLIFYAFICREMVAYIANTLIFILR